jgi:hypothetical protein
VFRPNSFSGLRVTIEFDEIETVLDEYGRPTSRPMACPTDIRF